MSVRLTKTRREQITARVLDVSFTKKINVALGKVTKAFPKFRRTLLGRHAKAFDSLPERWHRDHRVSSVPITVPSGGNYHIRLPEATALPARISISTVRRKSGEYEFELTTGWSNRGVDDYFDDPAAAVEVLRPSLVELITLLDERGVMQQEVDAIVSGVTTEKRLYEVWPELIEIVPPTESKARGTAIAVNIDNLNRKIPLPQNKSV